MVPVPAVPAAVNKPVDEMDPMPPVTLQVGETFTYVPALLWASTEKILLWLIPTVTDEGLTLKSAASPFSVISPQPLSKMTNDK